MGMTDVQAGRPPADHAAHDPLLIARAASDDDLTPTEQAAVADRLATCADCAQLHADLLAMTAGLRTDLPLPRRPRDFRLSPDALVRGLSWRERLSRGLAGPALRPLAATICALGLLVAVTGAVLPRAASTAAPLSNVGSAVTDQGVPAAQPGAAGAGATAAASGENDSTKAGSGPSAVGVDLGSPQPRPSIPAGAFGQPPSGGAGDLAGGSIPPTVARTVDTPGPDQADLLIASGVLLFVGGGGAFLILRRRST
jgi:hypothetical protein